MLALAVCLLAQTVGGAWVNKGSVWQMIMRHDASFRPKDHCHASFAEMAKVIGAVFEIKNGGMDRKPRVRSQESYGPV